MAATSAIRKPQTNRRFGLTLWLVRSVPASVAIALIVVTILMVLAAVGEWLWPVSPNAQNLYLIAAKPGAAHWLGTDTLGRDVFARVIAGARSAVVGPLIIAASGLVVSSLLGVSAAYLGGAVDNLTLRVVDIMLALPGLLIAIVIVSLGGGGYWMAILVLSILNVQGDIRIVRGAALDQKSLPYIEAARILGIPRWRIMFMHILPNISAILVADFALDFALALVALSGLAFLGLGAQPGTPEWGTMLSDNEAILFTNPLGSLAPAAAIVLLAVSVNLIGDWIFDRYAGRGRFVR
jgi:peptide/nickel transport system permease protein